MIIQELRIGFLALLVLISCSHTNAQDVSLQGWTFSIATGEPILLQKAREGAPSISLKQNTSFGLNYLRRVNNKTYLETGVAFTNGKIAVTSAPHPDIPSNDDSYNLQMINVPLFVRANIGRHFFINGGLLADIDVSSKPYISRQSGLGSGLSFGGQISLSEKVTLSLAPYLQVQNLLSWKAREHAQHVAEAGFRLGFNIWKN